MSRSRVTIPAVAAALAALLALAGCGGSSHHTNTTVIAKAKVKSSLPQRAKVLFASDQGVSAPVSSAHLSGRVIAAIPFNPAVNGFSFQNYGFIAGTELDPQAMRELFGDGVCATAPSDSCTLTPAAQQWAQQVAEEMAGGHCYGFSMVALRFFTHNLSPSTFGAGTVYGLGLSAQLQDEIAAGWATQTLNDARAATLVGQPSAVVNFLEHNFSHPSAGRYTLGMSNGLSGPQGEGHAITPFAIANLGNSQYAILVYDNNYPGTTRAVLVNAANETWRYQVQVNPNAPHAVWSGQGANNELDLAPVSTTEHTHPCPFCANAGHAGTTTISLGGNPVQHAHLLITAADGKRLGYVNGRFVDQIPGARLIRPDLSAIWKTNPEPVYQVPAGQKLTVTLSGGDPTGHDAAQVHITGPGFGATVANLTPTSSSSAQVTVLPGGASLAVKLGGSPSSAPTLQLARDKGRTGNLLVATPTALRTGSRFTVGLLPTGKGIHVSNTGTKTPVAITLHTVGPQGTKTVQKSGVAVAAGQTKNLSSGLIQVG